MSDRPLVIFDCDGVLVDSEPVSVRVLVTALNRHGIAMAEEEAYSRFLGRSLATMTQVMDEEYGFHTGPEFLEGLRIDLYERFHTELQAIKGIADTVDKLDGAHCVASSSQPERIRLSLSLTGLLDKFEPNIFSASMVENGKPAPDLFLLAAETMGYDPKNCIVVEDSPAGIEAAQRAGMTALAFTGGSHTHVAGYRERIEALKPDAIFDAMPDLLHLVQKQFNGHKGPVASRSL